jgi:hypothetical protein
MNDEVLGGKLTAWHERRVVYLEKLDRFQSSYEQITSDELGLGIGLYGPNGDDRKARLARFDAVRSDLSNAFSQEDAVLNREAYGLLSGLVEAGLISYKLGAVGENASEHVRDIQSGRPPQFGSAFILESVVATGRLVAPSAARCIKCSIARAVGEFDVFTSPTSGELLYVCHGRQRPPEDRLGFGALFRWQDDWGAPCTDLE